MTNLGISARAIAKQIAQQMDKMDKNPDGKISKKVWNDIFHVKEKGGKEIQYFITVENAEKSILAYLNRSEKNANERLNLSKQWFNSLSKTTQNDKNDEITKDGGMVQEIVVSAKKRNWPKFLTNQPPTIDTQINVLDVNIPDVAKADTSEDVKPLPMEKITPYVFSENAQTEFKPSQKPEFNVPYAPLKEIPEPDITDNEVFICHNYNSQKLKEGWAHVRTMPDAFYEKVLKISKMLNCNPTDLMALMVSESTLSAQRTNSIGATGLIQFMPDTARRLGTTTNKLRKMSPVEQLDYVYKFLDNAKTAAGYKQGDYIDAGTLYALTFLPGRAKRTVLTALGEKFYRQNTALDYDKDGKITKADLSSVLESKKA